MSFGIGIGDVLSIIKLSKTVYESLHDAAPEFESLRLEVSSLHSSLKALGEEANSPTSLIPSVSQERREDLRKLLENCRKGLAKLEALVLRYPRLREGEKGMFLERVRFAAKDKNGPREKLAIHTASVNLFLTTLTHGALGRLEFLLRNQGGAGFAAHVLPVTNTTLGGGGGGGGGSHTVTGYRTDPYGRVPSTDAKTKKPWTKIKEDLQKDGVTEAHVEHFSEHIKAYVRFLVLGNTPFAFGAPGDLRGSKTIESVVVVHERVGKANKPSPYRTYSKEISLEKSRDDLEVERRSQAIQATRKKLQVIEREEELAGVTKHTAAWQKERTSLEKQEVELSYMKKEMQMKKQMEESARKSKSEFTVDAEERRMKELEAVRVQEERAKQKMMEERHPELLAMIDDFENLFDEDDSGDEVEHV